MTADNIEPALNRNKYGRPDQRAGELQARRPRAHQEYPSARPHAAAALCARQGRRGRAACAAATCIPDTVAAGEGENPQWLYTVVFDGRELWGEDSDPTLTVSIEAFEPYLEPA